MVEDGWSSTGPRYRGMMTINIMTNPPTACPPPPLHLEGKVHRHITEVPEGGSAVRPAVIDLLLRPNQSGGEEEGGKTEGSVFSVPHLLAMG